MKVLFINDATSNPNWGDRAASIALLRMIVATGASITRRITEYELGSGTFLGARDPGQSLAAEGSGHRWLDLLLPPAVGKVAARLRASRNRPQHGYPIPDHVRQFDSLSRAILAAPGPCGALLSAIEDADLAMIHGDGCMVGNGPLPRAELFLAYFIKTQFRKPVALVDHTADFDHPALLAMARRVYPLLDDIVYRDHRSVTRWQDQWAGRYAADSAFLFEPLPREEWLSVAGRESYFDVWPDIARFDPRRPYVCIGGSSIYAFKDRPTDIIAGFVALIEHLRTVYPGQIVLTASDGKDQRIMRPVAAQLDLPLISLLTPVQQAVDVVGNAAAYIGGRWHTSIFALRGGTPVIPLSAKTFKMQALVEMAELPVAAFDAQALDTAKEDIGRALNACLDQGDVLRDRLRRWAESQAADCVGNVRILGALN